VEQGSVIEVKAGDLRGRLPEVLDLCSDCGSLFFDFIQSGHQAAHTGPVAATPAPLGVWPS
jgi:hypothetical protein